MLSINDFFLKNKAVMAKKNIVLSIDLDGTLVNRKIGANYIDNKTLYLFNKLQGLKKLFLVPNTGREIIGFRSFQRETLSVKNGILGSGSLILSRGKLFFDSNSRIDNRMLDIFYYAVKKNILPFIDISYKEGRVIFYNKLALEYKDLFFSQNPKEWFNNKYPPTKPIEVANAPDQISRSSFRIEFPVFHNHKPLYKKLIKRDDGAMYEFVSLFPKHKIQCDKYSIERKAFLNEKYKNTLIFARFERNIALVNKGTGLKKWLKISNINHKDSFIIHIGDRDSGLVNDTVIKSSIPDAHIIMVGNECKLGNPAVDLYLRGDTDENIYLFTSGLYINLKKIFTSFKNN